MSDTRNDMKLYTVCIEMVCVIDEIHDGICSQNDFIVQQKLSQVLKIIQSEVQQILSVNNEEEQQLWMDVLAQLLSAQEQEDYSRIILNRPNQSEHICWWKQAALFPRQHLIYACNLTAKVL